jgi:hypothetical protein
VAPRAADDTAVALSRVRRWNKKGTGTEPVPRSIPVRFLSPTWRSVPTFSRLRGPPFTVSPGLNKSRRRATATQSPGIRPPTAWSIICGGSVRRSFEHQTLSTRTDTAKGFDQYHEPPNELSEQTRTFARMITSLIEEAEAIGWYEQRLALEKDKDAVAIMKNAQHEEMKHFGMDLEFLLRKKPEWREIAKGILFQKGDIVKHGDEAEEASEDKK